MQRPGIGVVFLAAAGLLLACSSGSNGTGPNGNTPVLSKASPSGDGQSAGPGSPLGSPLRVQVRQNNVPQSGVVVNWSVTAGGGALSPTQTTTNAQGIAQTSWTLGPALGQQTAQAAASNVSGSPISFTATASNPVGNATITVRNDFFDPQNVVINPGGVVSFTWAQGSVSHNVLPTEGRAIPTSPNAPNLLSFPTSFDVVFATAGAYGFYCSNHGEPGARMHGTVVVQ